MQAVIFDCFGVLYGSSIEFLTQQCAPGQRSELADLNKQFDYGFIDTSAYERGVAELLGWTAERTHQAIWQKRVRNSALIEYIGALRQAGSVKLGLLSNVGAGTLNQLFEPGELDRLFEVQVLSYQENLAKPNPEIFRLAARRLGVAPSECVMIDDRPENCEGAEMAGMRSLQHTSNALTIERLNKLIGEK